MPELLDELSAFATRAWIFVTTWWLILLLPLTLLVILARDLKRLIRPLAILAGVGCVALVAAWLGLTFASDGVPAIAGGLADLVGPGGAR